MRKLFSAFVCLVALPIIAQGPPARVIHGTGDPRAQSPIPDCTFDKMYIDDQTGDVYTSAGFRPCTWTPRPAGAGTITGQIGNRIPKASGSTALTAPSSISDDGTTVSTTEPVSAASFAGAATGLTGTAASLNIGGNAATATLATSATSAANSSLLLGSAWASPPPFGNTVANSINGTTGAFSGTLTGQQIGASSYAKQYGNGTTTGISSAVAANALVVADPSYATTEQYNTTSAWIPSLPAAPFQFQDQRSGITTNFHWNNGQAQPNFGQQAMIYDVCANAGSPTSYGQNITLNIQCHALSVFDTSVGFAELNPVVGVVGSVSARAGTWAATYNGLGIHTTFGANLSCYSGGDCITQYNYVSPYAGGYKFPSSEGAKPFGGNVQQGTFAPSGPCTSGCTTGSTAVKITTSFGAGNTWGDGRPVIDTTQSPIATTVTLIAATALGTGGQTMTTASTNAISNAWGTINSNVLTPRNMTPPTFATSETFNVTVTSGTPDTTHLVCFVSQFHENAIPTVMTFVSGATWTMTVPLRHAKASGSRWFQGGMCGYGMESTATTTPSGGAILSSLRYLFDVYGSTTANTIETGAWFPTGAVVTSLTAQNTYAFFNVATLSSSGTTVSGSYVSAGSTLTTPTAYNKSSIIIAGTSTVLDGVCSNMIFVTTTFFTCTHAGLSGNTTAATGTAQLANTAGTALNAINLWPMAELLDIQDYTTANCLALNLPSICADGTLTLEPNILPIANGDTLENEQDQAMKMQGMTLGGAMYNSTMQQSGGLSISMSGKGVQGGTGSTSSNAALSVAGSGGTDTDYLGNGGNLLPWNVLNESGLYYNGFNLGAGPAPSQSVIVVTPKAAQLNDPNYIYNAYSGINKASGTTLSVTPFNGAAVLNTNGLLTLSGSSIAIPSVVGQVQFGDRIFFAAMGTAPTATLTANTYGGTLADSTSMGYYVVAQNNVGNSIHGVEATVTTGVSSGNNSVKITWAHVAGAKGYQVCGRTPAGELQMITLTGYDNTTFIDNGSITPATACSAADTTQGNITNAASVGIQTPGTTTQDKLVSPSGAGGATITVCGVTCTMAPLASPVFTGAPAAPTQAAGDTSTDVATDAFVYASTAKVNTCGTTTTCSNTAQASPRIVWGNVTLSGGTATVTTMTAFTATTSFACTVSDTATTPAAASYQIVSTSSITVKGTGTDVITYQCIGN